MGNIIRTKKLEIRNVIIKPDNIVELIDIILDEFHTPSCNCKINDTDGIIYSTTNINELVNKKFLNKTKIEKIELSFIEENNNPYYVINKVNVVISKTIDFCYASDNQVVIESINESWLNNIYTKLFSDISRWEKQGGIRNYKFLIKSTVTLIILAVCILIAKFIIEKYYGVKNLTGVLIFIGLAFSGLSVLLSSTIFDHFLKFWPIVEIQNDQSHLNIEANKRIRLYQFISLIIIPFVLSILLEFFF